MYCWALAAAEKGAQQPGVGRAAFKWLMRSSRSDRDPHMVYCHHFCHYYSYHHHEHRLPESSDLLSLWLTGCCLGQGGCHQQCLCLLPSSGFYHQSISLWSWTLRLSPCGSSSCLSIVLLWHMKEARCREKLLFHGLQLPARELVCKPGV